MNKELKKWIEDYDAGNEMTSVSMGGISKGYEEAIQILAIEAMRNLQIIEMPIDRDEFSTIVNCAVDAAASFLDKKHGFSGAQVGAAKNMAAVFWRQTPEKGIQMMKDSNPDRLILIKKSTDSSAVVISDRF